MFKVINFIIFWEGYTNSAFDACNTFQKRLRWARNNQEIGEMLKAAAAAEFCGLVGGNR